MRHGDWIAVFIFLAIVMFAAYLALYEAYGYSMEPLLAWSNNPNICLWDSKYNDIYVDGIIKWDEGIAKMWGVDQIMLYEIIYPDTPWDTIQYCHIIVTTVQVEYTQGIYEYQGIMGRTNPAPEYNKVYVTIFEERNLLKDADFEVSISHTFMHEIGHAIGLNHWMPQNAIEAIKPWPKTLMWPWQKSNLNETSVDLPSLMALNCFYGSDGWKGPNDKCPVFNIETEYLK